MHVSDCVTATQSVGIVGARGYVGAELLRYVHQHPSLWLSGAWSRSYAGTAVQLSDGRELGVSYETPTPDAIARCAPDVLFLALPNGHSGEYVRAACASSTPPRLIVDLSADHRFDDSWCYGLSEHRGDGLSRAALVSNPGCYATAVQLALRPVIDMCAGMPHAFGVSGYSGAGSTPSDRNNPELLRDSVVPYGLVGHVHEREISYQLGMPVRFMPSVAAFFRGIVVTLSIELCEPVSLEQIEERFVRLYANQPCIDVVGRATPALRDVVNTPRAAIGGLCVSEDGVRASAVCVIDNLCKGAASQAIQNTNLALGLPETMGLYG